MPRQRSMHVMISSDVTGFPSCHVKSSRTVNVNVLPSPVTAQSAIWGWIARLSSMVTTVSKMWAATFRVENWLVKVLSKEKAPDSLTPLMMPPRLGDPSEGGVVASAAAGAAVVGAAGWAAAVVVSASSSSLPQAATMRASVTIPARRTLCLRASHFIPHLPTKYEAS